MHFIRLGANCKEWLSLFSSPVAIAYTSHSMKLRDSQIVYQVVCESRYREVALKCTSTVRKGNCALKSDQGNRRSALRLHCILWLKLLFWTLFILQNDWSPRNHKKQNAHMYEHFRKVYLEWAYPSVKVRFLATEFVSLMVSQSLESWRQLEQKSRFVGGDQAAFLFLLYRNIRITGRP